MAKRCVMERFFWKKRSGDTIGNRLKCKLVINFIIKLMRLHLPGCQGWQQNRGENLVEMT
eukprot:2716484-Ditylum_brightwellii.AAC.1